MLVSLSSLDCVAQVGRGLFSSARPRVDRQTDRQRVEREGEKRKRETHPSHNPLDGLDTHTTTARLPSSAERAHHRCLLLSASKKSHQQTTNTLVFSIVEKNNEAMLHPQRPPLPSTLICRSAAAVVAARSMRDRFRTPGRRRGPSLSKLGGPAPWPCTTPGTTHCPTPIPQTRCPARLRSCCTEAVAPA